MDDINKIKIKIDLKENKGNLLANAHVCIDTEFGIVTIKYLQIWKSNFRNPRLQEYINIEPPSIKVYGSKIFFVFFENKDKWYELEEKIYDQFFSATHKTSSINEDIDVNEIPENL